MPRDARTGAAAHHDAMRRNVFLLTLMLAAPAVAVDRIELRVGRVDGPGWQLREVRGSWQIDGALRVATSVRAERLPGPLRIELSCPHVQTQSPLGCESLQASARIEQAGTLEASAALRLGAEGDWQLQLQGADLQLQYNSADGRLAAENLRIRLSGEAGGDGRALHASLQARTEGGLAYVEPFFVDFGAQPLQLDARLRDDDGTLQIEQFDATQAGVGTITARGTMEPATWTQRHELFIEAHIDDAAAATTLYAQPALAATAAQDLALAGTLALKMRIRDARPLAIDVRLRDLDLAIPRYGVSLDELQGDLAWTANAPAGGSQIHWAAGQLGRLPIGPAQLQLRTSGTTFELTAPSRLPLLDGSVDIERLALSGLGGADLQAEFAARLQPIDLRKLCQALGWPEFSGTLAGNIPGLHLRDRRLELDGALTASAFDGEIRIGALSVIDPFGVLPRVSGDIRLRRLDLAAVTGAFDFGRITGRLDGDIDGLRLIGWEPVAMDAHLYSTPDDRSRRRISQRAIDNISAVGGGPTGLLSRGVMRFFDDFAYRRIGWRCTLDNGICHMDGIRASDEGDGYVLVQGWGLPRIDVVGYSRRVSWPVFMSQLRSIGKTGPAKVGDS